MNFWGHILNRLTVLYVVFTEGGREYTLFELGQRHGKVEIKNRQPGFHPATGKGRQRKHPVVIVLSGCGIVSKEYPAGSEMAARITGHPEEFLYASEALESGRQLLTFLRREQYNAVIREWSSCKLPLVGIRIDPKGDAEQEAQASATEFFGETLSRKSLLKASSENNALWSLMTGKLLLPVLGVIALGLLVNFFVRQCLQQQAEEQQFLLSWLQQTTAVRDQEQGQQRQLQEMLLPKASYPNAWLADRIASIVPNGVVLIELSIQPTTKKLQENKPLQADPNRIVIRGESAVAAPVTQLTDTLRSLKLASSVQLLSLTRDRNGQYLFEIDLRL